MKFSYLTNCVALSQADVPDLDAMQELRLDVSYLTFTRHCNWQPWALTLGYKVGLGAGLHLSKDWHVNYYRSSFRGQPCYYAKHSAIEHIFTLQKTVAAINRPW